MKISTDKWGMSPTYDYKPERKTVSKPLVVDQFSDDEGVLWYILESGNQINAERYNAMWNPPKKEMKTDRKWKGGTIVGSHIPNDAVIRDRKGKVAPLI